MVLYSILKYFWTGIILTHDFLNSLQTILAFIHVKKDHQQSGISEWKKKVYFLMSPSVNNVWTQLCEHAYVNCFFKDTLPYMSMYNVSVFTCTCTTMWLGSYQVPPMWTMCEHNYVNMHMWIVSLKTLYPLCPCTMYVYLHVHVLQSYLDLTKCHPCEQCVNTTVWTCICELFL